MPSISAARVVVEILKTEGVKQIFGLPGGHVIGIFDALYDTPEISFVRTRHEHAAAYMACAYAQLTGEVGICLVTAGPGATNLTTGISEAFTGALPVVVLAGRGATAFAHRGDSQEVATDRIFAPITKWSVRVDRADLVPEILYQAFTIARSGRPGPVYLDLPADVLAQDIAFTGYRPSLRPAPVRADSQAIAAAGRALAAAARPLIVAGGGAVASGAQAEVKNLAERLDAPVVTSLSGRTIISDDHPLSAGGLGTHSTPVSQKLLNEADVVLNLGCRFEAMETNWEPIFSPAPDACVIQVNIDPNEIGRSLPATIGLVADVKTVVADLLAALGRRPAGQSFEVTRRIRTLRNDIDELDRTAERLAASNETPIHPIRVIRAVRKIFPRESTIGIDIGCLAEQMAGAFPWFRIYEPRSMIVPSSYYGMGDSAAGLPVARIVYPDRPAVGFVGDGSFQMMMDVLPVAAEYRLGVTWCILNDYALGSIWDIQNGPFGKRFIATEFANQPDFAKVAEACGCYGEKIEAPGDVEGAVQRALEANAEGRPAVLDFAVARHRTPQTAKFFHIADAVF